MPPCLQYQLRLYYCPLVQQVKHGLSMPGMHSEQLAPCRQAIYSPPTPCRHSGPSAFQHLHDLQNRRYQHRALRASPPKNEDGFLQTSFVLLALISGYCIIMLGWRTLLVGLLATETTVWRSGRSIYWLEPACQNRSKAERFSGETCTELPSLLANECPAAGETGLGRGELRRELQGMTEYR